MVLAVPAARSWTMLSSTSHSRLRPNIKGGILVGGHQCCGAANFFGRLLLQTYEVSEPTSAKWGRPRLQAKKGGSRRLRLETLKVFILSSAIVNYYGNTGTSYGNNL